MRFWRKRHFLTGLAIAACIGIACCVAFQLNLLHGMQLRSTDFLFRTPYIDQTTNSADNIVIVAIDDESLNQLGYFSLWPRTHYAHVLDILAKAKARTVAFDVLFSEPAPGDEQLARSIRDAANVVLPTVETSMMSSSTTTDKSGRFLRPLVYLEESAIALGHANVFPDEDGVVRRLPIVIQNGDDYEPALALAAVAKYLRRPEVIESQVKDKVLPFAGRSIPIDSNNEMLINYVNGYGEYGGITFPTVSFVDVLRGTTNSELLRDKVIIIGATASGLADVFWTPVGQMNGVKIHANAMSTVLTGHFLELAPSAISIASILILALLCGLITLRFRLLWATVSTLSLCVVYFLLVCACFDKGIMLNALYPPLAIVGTFGGINLFNVASERSQRNAITKTFGRYVSASVADRIMEALGQGTLKLGGKEQEVTVAFADLRGFTSMAENMQSGELVRVLNIYLSIVIKAVLKYKGIINKFGGDSVLAIWNVPIPCEGHPLLAINAAMETQLAIKELQEREPLLPKTDFGIGINTGTAVAGNMGSEVRVEYSVIGDAVNLAARLTNATPGGKVWISDNTFKLVKDCISAKSLDELVVKGKQEPVRAYEVVDVYPESVIRKATIQSVTRCDQNSVLCRRRCNKL